MILQLAGAAAVIFLLTRPKVGAAAPVPPSLATAPVPAPIQAAPDLGTAVVQQAPLPPPVPLLNTSMPPAPAPSVFVPGNPSVAPVNYIPVAFTSAPVGNPQFTGTPIIGVAPSNTRAADQAAGASVAKNLQIAVATNKAGGMYQGYGVPLSGQGMFAPLASTDYGTFDTSSLGINNIPPASLQGDSGAGTSSIIDSGGTSGYGL